MYQFASCVPVNGLTAFTTAGGLYVLEAFTPVVVTQLSLTRNLPHGKNVWPLILHFNCEVVQ